MHGFDSPSASFDRRPDIHGSLLGLFGFMADPVVDDEPAPVAPVKPEYDERFAFETADSCSCHIDPPCSYCTSRDEED